MHQNRPPPRRPCSRHITTSQDCLLNPPYRAHGSPRDASLPFPAALHGRGSQPSPVTRSPPSIRQVRQDSCWRKTSQGLFCSYGSRCSASAPGSRRGPAFQTKEPIFHISSASPLCWTKWLGIKTRHYPALSEVCWYTR